MSENLFSNQELPTPNVDRPPSDEVANREKTGMSPDESGRTTTFSTGTNPENPQHNTNTDAPAKETDPEDAVRNPTDPETTTVERPTPGPPLNLPHASELDEQYGTRFSNVAPEDNNVSRISPVAGILVGQNNKDLVDPTADNRRGDDFGATPPIHTFEDGSVGTTDGDSLNRAEVFEDPQQNEELVLG